MVITKIVNFSFIVAVLTANDCFKSLHHLHTKVNDGLVTVASLTDRPSASCKKHSHISFLNTELLIVIENALSGLESLNSNFLLALAYQVNLYSFL